MSVRTPSTPGPHFSGIPLESDPEIFTDILHAISVKSLQLQDLISLDAEELKSLLPGPVHALILIHSTTKEYEDDIWKARQDARDAGLGYDGHGSDEPVIWFEQTIRHACGFMALLHAVANLEKDVIGGRHSSPQGWRLTETIDPTSHLATLLNAALPLHPPERAELLKSSASLGEIYTAASTRGTSTILRAEDETPGHYLCFVPSPRNGHIYELDGGKNGPVDHDEWLGGDRDILSGGLKLVKEFIENRTDKENPHCHVMALVDL
ncbi:Ubiquitin carboxyl-terminal hydrolase [Mycena kentingensis (nom. inval.)]|nr:Ubiquitin carboxyl-terminal hydrolase [Mycena kentingensis (nom. inval.)]